MSTPKRYRSYHTNHLHYYNLSSNKPAKLSFSTSVSFFSFFPNRVATNNVGWFNDNIAYANSGEYIGEMYNEDRIGFCRLTLHIRSIPRIKSIRLAIAKLINQPGMPVMG